MNKFNVTPLGAGRFISRGKGRHQTRTIQTDEIFFCVKGVLSIFEEQQSFELHPGDYFISRHGKQHGSLYDYPAGLSYFWLHMEDPDGSTLHIPQSGHITNFEQLSIYFQSYLAEQQLQHPNKEILQHLLSLILLELERADITNTPSQKISKLALRAADIIKFHFSEPLNVDSVAQLLHCNSEYLGRIFHFHFKETFSAMLNRTRVEHAAKLLIDGKLSIKEIINECGFNDPAYFRRIFYRRYALTPTGFRKFHNSGHNNTE